MSKKKSKEPKYKGKQCITWKDSDGDLHRTRFFKGTSVRVIERELEAKQQNLSCYDVKVTSKDSWVRVNGEVDSLRVQPKQHVDLSMLTPDYSMKKWKQENRNYYYNSIF